ncbi:MAG: proline--tRNA ligase [Spirochaetes bacterium]|nr:proline--tRNA ligase [Spirochaetota bacterium]
MLLSQYFFKTIKEIPNDAELQSHQLLIRGGYIKQVSAGIFTYLPLAVRILHKIKNIIREEMDAIGGVEINMPVVMPASLWMETGRYEVVGDELLRFEDRIGRKMLLGMTHEEGVTDLVRYVVSSYKQLPFMLYQIQTKFRDEPRVRGGLIRVREFSMKDAYSFHTKEGDLEQFYLKVYKAYQRIFARCGLPVITVASDVGMMGGSGADEFMTVTESGEDTLIICQNCDYKANKEVAKALQEYPHDILGNKQEVHTPNKMSIQEVADYLKITPAQTLKAVVYIVEEQMVMCVIRGDIEVNETKLRGYLKVKDLRFATDEELAQAGIVKGFATPVNLAKNIRLIVDETAAHTPNLVAGGNKINYHVKNVNYSRDYQSNEVIDISTVKGGDKCPQCGGQLHITRGIEVGNIFKLGTKYSESMGARYLDQNGKEQDIFMGCYGIGIGRLMASLLEIQGESKITWPITVTPFEVELLGFYKDKDSEVKATCFQVYQQLKEAGIDVLFDDRNASPGFKFNDADLIGCPVKIAIGNKSIQNGGAEVTVQNEEKIIIPIEKLVETIKNKMEILYEKLSIKRF